MDALCFSHFCGAGQFAPLPVHYTVCDINTLDFFFFSDQFLGVELLCHIYTGRVCLTG